MFIPPKIIECRLCTQLVKRGGTRQIYCKPCAKAMDLSAKYRWKREHPHPWMPSNRFCKRCHSIYLATSSSSRYCAPCGVQSRRDIVKRYLTKNRDLLLWKSKVWKNNNPEKVRAEQGRSYKKRNAAYQAIKELYPNIPISNVRKGRKTKIKRDAYRALKELYPNIQL